MVLLHEYFIDNNDNNALDVNMRNLGTHLDRNDHYSLQERSIMCLIHKLKLIIDLPLKHFINVENSTGYQFCVSNVGPDIIVGVGVSRGYTNHHQGRGHP